MQFHQQQFDVSVESCDLNGGRKTNIITDSKLKDFAWIAPGRFIFSRSVEGGTDYYSNNLWDLRVDARSGTAQGKPRRLTDWASLWVRGLSATADGKHLEFLRGASHEFVFVGDLTSSGTRLVNPRRLTVDDSSNFLPGLDVRFPPGDLPVAAHSDA